MNKGKTTLYPFTAHDVCAYHLNRTTISIPRPGEKSGPAQPVEKLPLIIRRPQWVRFADRNYHILKEGLYRFWDWGKVRRIDAGGVPKVLGGQYHYACLIYFKKNIPALLGALAAIHVHGKAHMELPYKKRLAMAKTGALSVTCGDISDFTCELLAGLGIRTRRAGAMRVQGEYNSYDNGHQLLEFYWPKFRKWVLADVDGHVLFKSRSRYLNLGEVSDLIQRGGDFDLEPLTPHGFGCVDTTDAVAGRFHFAAFCEPIFLDPVLKKQWFRRTLEIPYFTKDGTTWFFCRDPKKKNRVEKATGHKSLDTQKWFELFYEVKTSHPLKGRDSQ